MIREVDSVSSISEKRTDSASPISPVRAQSPFRNVSPVNCLFEGCDDDNVIQFHQTRLENMMKMSKNGRLPPSLRENYERDGLPALQNRAKCVRWIKTVSPLFPLCCFCVI